jgi:hypothetical protein
MGIGPPHKDGSEEFVLVDFLLRRRSVNNVNSKAVAASICFLQR